MPERKTKSLLRLPEGDENKHYDHKLHLPNDYLPAVAYICQVVAPKMEISIEAENIEANHRTATTLVGINCPGLAANTDAQDNFMDLVTMYHNFGIKPAGRECTPTPEESGKLFSAFMKFCDHLQPKPRP